MLKNIILLITMITAVLMGSTKSSDNEVIIKMYKNKFVPSVVNIQPGTTVVWINEDKIMHNVVFTELKKRSKFLRKGEKYQLTFNEVGTFDYFCQPHKAMGMVGTIKVKNGNSGKKQIRRNSNTD